MGEYTITSITTNSTHKDSHKFMIKTFTIRFCFQSPDTATDNFRWKWPEAKGICSMPSLPN